MITKKFDNIFNKTIASKHIHECMLYIEDTSGDFSYNNMYGDKIVSIPRTVISSRASGGCITTANDLMIFIKSFFEGKLFDKSIFYKLSVYNKLQVSKGPIYYGGGYMQIPLKGVTTLFMGKGDLLI